MIDFLVGEIGGGLSSGVEMGSGVGVVVGVGRVVLLVNSGVMAGR